MYSNGKVNSAKLQLLLHQPTTTSWKHNGEQDMHNSSLHKRTFLGANIAFESLGLLIYKKKQTKNKPGMPQVTGSQRVGHDFATEQNGLISIPMLQGH